MRLNGTIRSWRDDKGFGFITPAEGMSDLFVHISAFPADGSRPTVGERVSYELGRGKDGKPQAIRVQRKAIGHTAPPHSPRTPPHDRNTRRRSGTSVFGTPLLLVLLGAIGYYGFTQYSHRVMSPMSPPTPQAEQPVTAPVRATAPPNQFRCDGRLRCAQMTSCSEAKFFLQNCPGTQMDGNHDGTPCEQQWCTSPLAR